VALDSHELTEGAELLLGFPEHRVSLPGGGHPSQNDLWAILRAAGRFVSLAVEAKAGEPLDKPVAEWLRDAKTASGKPERLAFLKARLGIDASVDHIRYQLLHRTVSALLEAQRFGCDVAVLLIQSFGGERDRGSFDDFVAFATMLGCHPSSNALHRVTTNTVVPLLVGWSNSSTAGETTLAAAV
jgi:hypothetical protein